MEDGTILNFLKRLGGHRLFLGQAIYIWRHSFEILTVIGDSEIR